MLLNVVNPSAEIREGFENYVVRTLDGRTLTGFIADQDANVVVIRGADGQNLTVPRDNIEDMRATRQSVMPEGQLKALTDQQIRDLFAYLRSTQPLP
jgi:putative heme-binding domain-containing protein